ncbi:hypothetical protein RvY_04666-2 [Ramazzottius varieornatus]|uniref:Uncharacterized protein n=1 Tax=Ramazzottius varieornatus TaxID=947166 RepID=A0A1D1UVQ0_RAMVA|nr:hypothetical protein RvY_04666-2 [Ramazzottius varieornatus]
MRVRRRFPGRRRQKITSMFASKKPLLSVSFTLTSGRFHQRLSTNSATGAAWIRRNWEKSSDARAVSMPTTVPRNARQSTGRNDTS